jgi:diguanylate cyclase (GGDEF)-like protein
MFGISLKNAELFKHVAVARTGHFETRSITDNIHRLVAYSQVGDLPLVIGVGQSTKNIYQEWRSYAIWMGSIMALLSAMSVALAVHLARETKRRNAAEASLASLATTDSLTGLHNRRAFTDVMAREWQRAMREGHSIALLLFDVDHFKSYNDRFGHQAGDSILKEVATAAHLSLRRGSDIAARLGGDEFAILLPMCTRNGAIKAAERLQGAFSACGLVYPHATVTLSIGIAAVRPGASNGCEELIAAADRAAYRAKQRGRNRIEADVDGADLDFPLIGLDLGSANLHVQNIA